MHIRKLHRYSGIGVALFALAHIGLQLLAVWNMELHYEFTEVARGYYRLPVAEGFLTILIGVQVGTGLLLSRQLHRDRVALVQRISGIYLALFLTIHLAAIYLARIRGIETNFEFAAAGFKRLIGALFFGPYYFFAVMAVFLHLACAIERLVERETRISRGKVLTLTGYLGMVVSTIVTAKLNAVGG